MANVANQGKDDALIAEERRSVLEAGDNFVDLGRESEEGLFVVIKFLLGEEVGVIIDGGIILTGEYLILEDEYIEMVHQQHELSVTSQLQLRQILLLMCVVPYLFPYKIDHFYYTPFHLLEELLFVLN